MIRPRRSLLGPLLLVAGGAALTVVILVGLVKALALVARLLAVLAGVAIGIAVSGYRIHQARRHAART